MPNYEYLFNEGSGSIINEVNSGPSLTLSGTYTWGSGYLELPGANSSNIFAAANGQLSGFVGSSFSIALWYQPTVFLTDQYRSILTIGDGGTGTGIFSGVESGTGRWWVSNGFTGLTGGTPTLASGTKYLLIITYNRVGGVNNNIITLRWTSDGITWNSNSRTDFPLLVVDNSYELRSNYNQGGGGTQNYSGRYYKLTMYENTILDNTQMQAIFDAGSEGIVEFPSFLDLQTFGSIKMLRLSQPPNTGSGYNAPISSIAFVNNSGTGEIWLKTGSSNTSWNKVSTI